MSRRDRGVTMILALGSMALVTIAVMTLASQGMRETRAVGRRIDTDQVDQLLLASTLSAVQRANQSTLSLHECWMLELPTGIEDAKVSLEAIDANANDATVTVAVMLGNTHANQTIRLHHTAAWEISSCVLD